MFHWFLIFTMWLWGSVMKSFLVSSHSSVVLRLMTASEAAKQDSWRFLRQVLLDWIIFSSVWGWKLQWCGRRSLFLSGSLAFLCLSNLSNSLLMKSAPVPLWRPEPQCQNLGFYFLHALVCVCVLFVRHCAVVFQNGVTRD